MGRCASQNFKDQESLGSCTANTQGRQPAGQCTDTFEGCQRRPYRCLPPCQPGRTSAAQQLGTACKLSAASLCRGLNRQHAPPDRFGGRTLQSQSAAQHWGYLAELKQLYDSFYTSSDAIHASAGLAQSLPHSAIVAMTILRPASFAETEQSAAGGRSSDDSQPTR